MSDVDLERDAYYADDGTLRIPCPHCWSTAHGFVGYSIREAARIVAAGKACS